MSHERRQDAVSLSGPMHESSFPGRETMSLSALSFRHLEGS